MPNDWSPGCHFQWVLTEQRRMRELIRTLRAKIESLQFGDEWAAIEAFEPDLAAGLLRLPVRHYIDEYLVPVTREYQWADNKPVGDLPIGGSDPRDLAIKARITIATPERVLLTISTCAGWARKGRRRLPKADQAWHREWDEENDLAALNASAVREALLIALTEWDDFLVKHGADFANPPKNRVRRLAIQLAELRRYLDQHRGLLIKCKHGLERAGAFGSGAVDVNELPADARDLWRRHVPLVRASHERIARCLSESLRDAPGVAVELERGLLDRSGPVESSIVKMLTTLHDDFEARTRVRPPFDECGYMWWHFDDVVEGFNAWSGPIEGKLYRASQTLRTVALPRANTASDSARKKKRGRKHKSDPSADERLALDWQAAKNQGQQLKEYCTAKGLNYDMTKRRLERHRKRRSRATSEESD